MVRKMSVYAKLFRGFIYPLAELRRPRNERNLYYLQNLEKTQWWKPEQLEELQNKKLRSLVNHAYNTVPYYHSAFRKLGLKPDDIKSIKDLPKLPIITKEDIRNNLLDMLSRDCEMKRISECTGGSTGEPLRFYVDQHKQASSWAASNRAYGWGGYWPGDKYVSLWGSSFDIRRSQRISQRIGSALYMTKTLDAFEMTDESMKEFVKIIRRFQPKMIRAYASAIFLFARYLQHEGILDIKPRVICTTAEKLFDHQREVIEGQFNCKVFDGYGSRETSVMAHECQEHTGYHIAVENGVMEFVRDNEHASAGELGEILVTDFNNYIMPFIRYEVGDAGIPSNDKCNCGRGLPLMKEIQGRVIDFITTPDGKRIHGLFFSPTEPFFWKTHWIKQFQVIQENREKLVIKIVPLLKPKREDVDELMNVIKNYMGEMDIEIELVEDIPTTKSGKRRVIISKVPVKFR